MYHLIRYVQSLLSRGKIQGDMIGYVEVTIWVAAISTVLCHLDNWVNILAYSVGFALGTVIGISFEQILGSGYV